MKGDPRRDEEELWTTMGHLYKGGIWFKKKTKISGFTNAHIPDNTTVDLRTVEQSFQNNTLTPDLPAANKMNNYFYLPDLGYYDSGYLKLKFVGYGYYWSSSAIPQNSGYAYLLSFNSNAVIVNRAIRETGMIVQPFE